MNKKILMVAIFFLSGCVVNYSVPAVNENLEKPANKGFTDNIQNLVTFSVNGEEVRTMGCTISRFVLMSDPARISLNITSSMHEDKRTINVNLNGAVPGKYPLGGNATFKSASYGSYFPDYTGDQQNSFSFTSGLFELTEVDTLKNNLNGSFYGEVKNSTGEVFELSGGKIINGLLKPGIAYY